MTHVLSSDLLSQQVVVNFNRRFGDVAHVLNIQLKVLDDPKEKVFAGFWPALCDRNRQYLAREALVAGAEVLSGQSSHLLNRLVSEAAVVLVVLAELPFLLVVFRDFLQVDHHDFSIKETKSLEEVDSCLPDTFHSCKCGMVSINQELGADNLMLQLKSELLGDVGDYSLKLSVLRVNLGQDFWKLDVARIDFAIIPNKLGKILNKLSVRIHAKSGSAAEAECKVNEVRTADWAVAS